jgi:hypothetical protein
MSVNLEYGDIIKLFSSKDKLLSDSIYIISYIDPNRIVLNSPDRTELILERSGDGLVDKGIERIEILSRSEGKGFVKQRNFNVGDWLLLTFMDDRIFGVITRIEFDSIEVDSVDKKNYYFDFKYRGPIDNLAIKVGDKEELEKLYLKASDEGTDEPGEGDLGTDDEPGEGDLGTDDEPGEDDLGEDDDEISDDEIAFGDDVVITTLEEVSDEKKRYDIDSQVQDLSEKLKLSVRVKTFRNLNNIKKIVERFIQLREKYVKMQDNSDIPESYIMKGDEYKPMVEALHSHEYDVRWIVPVTRNNKKNIYIGQDADDINNLHQIAELTDETAINIDTLRFDSEVENKLTAYNNKINDYYVPFVEEEGGTCLGSVQIATNINVLVETSRGLLSTVVSNDQLVDSYRQEVVYMKGSNLCVNGFVIKSLRDAYVNSKYLLQTNILSKVVLSNFNENKQLSHETHTVSDVESDKAYENDSYLKDDLYVLSDKNTVNYRMFTNTLVPNTSILLEKIVEKIKHGYSLENILEHLEVFLINKDDITHTHIDTIYKVIETAMGEHMTNTNYIKEQCTKYQAINKIHNNRSAKKVELDDDIEMLYGTHHRGTSETITILLERGFELVSSDIVNKSKDLYMPNPTDKIDEIEEKIKGELEEKDKDELCTKITISKIYKSKQDLEQDNDRTDVTFDKELDKTFYDMFADKNFSGYSPEDKKRYLMENFGLSDIDAQRDLDTIELGKRNIIDGDIAILKKKRGKDFVVFIRRKNKWKKNNELTAKILEQIKKNAENITSVDSENDLCNLIGPCIYLENRCRDKNELQRERETEIIDKMVVNMKASLDKEEEVIVQELEDEIEVAKKMLDIKNKIEEYKKIDFQKISYGNEISGLDEIVKSPSERILNLIMGQGDIALQMKNIMKFKENYTIGGVLNHMYLCKETKLPLLPSFLIRLSIAYRENRYNEAVDEICKLQGEISNDGDKWVDKYSGYTIKRINLDTGEGFDDKGFAKVTREIIEKDEDDEDDDSIEIAVKYEEEKDDEEIDVVIDEEVSLEKWNTFLPHLMEFKPDKFKKLSDGYYKKRISEKLVNTDKITKIASKQYNLSLNINSNILERLEKTEPLLKKADGTPYSTNTCCRRSLGTTDFYSEDTILMGYLEKANNYQGMYDEFRDYNNTTMMLNVDNTRTQRGVYISDYSEETKYSAIIDYCKFNKGNTIFGNVTCFNISILDGSKTLEEKVERIRGIEGYTNLTLEKLSELLTKKFSKNKITISVEEPISSEEQFPEFLDKPLFSEIRKVFESGDVYENVIDLCGVKRTKLEEKFSGSTGEDATIYRLLFEENGLLGMILDNTTASPYSIDELINEDYGISGTNITSQQNNREFYTISAYKGYITTIIETMYNYIKMIENDQTSYSLLKREIKIPSNWPSSNDHKKIVTNIINKTNSERESKLSDLRDSEVGMDAGKNVSLKALLSICKTTPHTRDGLYSSKIVINLFRYYLLEMLLLMTDILDDTEYIVILEFSIEYLANIRLNKKKIVNYVENIKNKEKQQLVKELDELQSDQRISDNELRKYGLGRWAIGTSKGLTTFDEEVFAKEIENANNEFAENEANDMSMTPDDDDDISEN